MTTLDLIGSSPKFRALLTEVDGEGEVSGAVGELTGAGVELATVVDVSCGRPVAYVAPPVTATSAATPPVATFHPPRFSRPSRVSAVAGPSRVAVAVNGNNRASSAASSASRRRPRSSQPAP